MSKQLKICMISDTHMMHRNLDMPFADLLIVAGDICGRGNIWEVEEFNTWLGEVRLAYGYKEVLLVPGNHDNPLTNPANHIALSNAKVLVSERFEYEGFVFYGTPYVTVYGRWDFQLGPQGLREEWAKIPEDTVVLITHMPAYGTLDNVEQGRQKQRFGVGCVHLKERIEELPNLKLHVFGHLHLDGGQTKANGKYIAVNAAMATEEYTVGERLPQLIILKGM